MATPPPEACSWHETTPAAPAWPDSCAPRQLAVQLRRVGHDAAAVSSRLGACTTLRLKELDNSGDIHMGAEPLHLGISHWLLSAQSCKLLCTEP